MGRETYSRRTTTYIPTHTTKKKKRTKVQRKANKKKTQQEQHINQMKSPLGPIYGPFSQQNPCLSPFLPHTPHHSFYQPIFWSRAEWYTQQYLPRMGGIESTLQPSKRSNSTENGNTNSESKRVNRGGGCDGKEKDRRQITNEEYGDALAAAPPPVAVKSVEMDSVAEKSDSSTAAHKPEFRGVIIDDEVKVLSSVENPLSVHGSFVLTKTGDRVLAPAPSGILARGKNTASPPESWFLPDVPVVEGHDGSGCPSGRAESNAAAPPKVEKEVAPRVKHQRWSPRISYDDPTCGTEVGGSGEGEGSVRVSMPERTIQSAAAATGTALAMEPSISESARSPDSKPHSRRFQRSKNRRPVGVPDAANISTEAPAVDIRGVGEMPTAAKNRFSAEHFPLVFDW